MQHFILLAFENDFASDDDLNEEIKEESCFSLSVSINLLFLLISNRFGFWKMFFINLNWIKMFKKILKILIFYFPILQLLE